MADCIWPQRTWPLRQLTEDQYAAWERDGFVVLPGLIPSDLCANAAAVIRKYIGADDSRPETWYANTDDIYDATLSPRPAHGPCGMVQLYHHATLWALRQRVRTTGAPCCMRRLFTWWSSTLIDVRAPSTTRHGAVVASAVHPSTCSRAT